MRIASPTPIAVALLLCGHVTAQTTATPSGEIPELQSSLWWEDFDADGAPDVLIGTLAGPSRLLRNQGNGTFLEVGEAAGLLHAGEDLHATWFDYDENGLPDLHVRTRSESLLYRNLGDGLFEQVELALAGPVSHPTLHGRAGKSSAADQVSHSPIVTVLGEEAADSRQAAPSGRLESGSVRVELDPIFLESVTVNEAHPLKVFVTLTGDCDGFNGFSVFKETTGFVVRELDGGTGSVTLDYRLIAKRRGLESKRLEPLESLRDDHDHSPRPQVAREVGE